MTTAEKYRQKEASAVIQVAKYLFNVTLKGAKSYLLGDLLVEVKTGKTPSKNEKKFYEDDFIDWYKPNEIGNSKFCLPSKEKLSKYAYDKKQVTIYAPNTILINAIGDVGRVSILNKEASSNQQITGIKPLPDKLNIEYCYYYLLANRYLFYKDLFKTTLPIVNQKKIKLLPIVVPSIEEQVFIVDFLNTLEDIDTIYDLDKDKWGNEYYDIANKFFGLKENSISISTELTHQLDIVKKLRQAFLREAMQGKLTSEWRTSHPELVEGTNSASELLAKIKAEKEQLIKDKKIKKQKTLPPITKEEIPFEIPENWVWCRLGEITTYGSSQKADPNKFNNDTWVLDLEDIEKETSRLLNKVRFNERNSLSTKSVFKFGDVLYSKLRPYLDKVIVADEDGVCTTEILPLKCFANTNPYFFRYALKRPDFISFVNSVTKGMKMPRLGTEEGRKALIPFPPLSEQILIGDKLGELMAYCDSLEESIKNSQTQNEMLLGQVLREALEPKTEKGTVI